MRRITAFLDDVVEERDRRARKAAAAALILAALALPAAMRPAPKPEIVHIHDPAPPPPPPVVKTVFRTEFVYAGTPPQRSVLTTAKDFADITPPPAPSPLERHLCISPRSIIAMRSDSATIFVSNPSPGEIGITGIRASSNRPLSGFDFDASDCRDRVLRQGERCVINICVRRRVGETMTLLVANDASNTPELMTVEALE